MHVLFVCASNVNRSQMAEAFLRFYMPDVKVTSAAAHPPQGFAGKPLEQITTDGIRAMAERGIDMRAATTKVVAPDMAQDATHIISMVPREALPPYVANAPEIRFWNVEDPGGKPYADLLAVRDQIDMLVRDFARELKAV